MPQREVYKLLVGGIVPRPIAWISTVSPDGRANLAPFSFFNGVSSAPPTVMISIQRNDDGSAKDTWRNIEATREFVVNSVSFPDAERMNQTSAPYPYGVSEFEKAGVTAVPSEKVKPPRVREARLQMECRLHEAIEIRDDHGVPSCTIVIGRVLLFHIAPEIYEKGRVLIAPYDPISRLGGFDYARVAPPFSIVRPKTAPP